MAGTASGQDEANLVLWLATRTRKMGLSRLLGISRVSPARKKFSWPYNKSILYWPKRRWRVISSCLSWPRLVNSAYVIPRARSTSLTAGYNATMRLRSHCFESCARRAYGSWRNLSDGRENKYTYIRITGAIRQAGVKLQGAASIFKKTAKSCPYETS